MIIGTATIVAGLAGAATGELEARLLRRSVTSVARSEPCGMLLRLALVGGVLTIAAIMSGHLLATAAGWALGFAVGVLIRWRRWS